MSIFKSVQQAEDKADSIKNKTAEQVDLLLEETRRKAEREASAIIENARTEAKSIEQKTLAAIAVLKQQIHDETEIKRRDIRDAADKNFHSIIEFVLDKVFSL